MKNNNKIIFASFLIITTISFFPIYAHAIESGESGESSATREAIERSEEKLLGAEKHTELEKVEPQVDATIKKTIPLAIGGVSVVLLVVALYLKNRKF
jgi:hypothetical protein